MTDLFKTLIPYLAKHPTYKCIKTCGRKTQKDGTLAESSLG